MSHSSYSSLHAVHETFLTNYFGEEISHLLSGRSVSPSGHPPDKVRDIDRHLSIQSRGGWFMSSLKELQAISGITGLEFMSGDFCTHTHADVTRQDGEIVWEETHKFTVVSPNYDKVIDSINKLHNWCLSNESAAAKALEAHPSDVSTAVESAYFTLRPNMEGFDEGQGIDFFFCTLRTIGDVARYAKAHRYWLIYKSTR